MILGIFHPEQLQRGASRTGGQNAELASDNNPITTVFRTDPSGENYILSDYLNTIDPAAWAKYTSTLGFPGGPKRSVAFPTKWAESPRLQLHQLERPERF